MSRHRKVKNLNYEDEYDDYYGAFDEDDEDDLDPGEDNFEAKYLSSGIDLNLSESSSTSKAKQHQLPPPPPPPPPLMTVTNKGDIDATKPGFSNDQASPSDVVQSSSSPSLSGKSGHLANEEQQSTPKTPVRPPLASVDQSTGSSCVSERAPVRDLSRTSAECSRDDSLGSDLTRLAIKHLDMHQWQLPLLEMDQKFRDKTYYKHYTDSYITSLRSKLGHFLADTRLVSNPMRHHAQRELDNYERHSKMFELLTDYYQSLGNSFFSFATPSPDEEIVIGCRLGTKVKKPPPPKQSSMAKDEQSTARFEYTGKPAGKQKPKGPADKASVAKDKQSVQSGQGATGKASGPSKKGDLTVQEDFTAEQLEKISKKYKEFQATADSSSSFTKQSVKFAQLISTSSSNKPSASSQATATSAKTAASQQSRAKSSAQQQASSGPTAPKQLATLTERRQNLKQRLKQSTEPSAQDWEAFKLRALQTTKEYSELMRGSRPRLNLVVAGHVDAGKSTLVGHLLYKLGQVSNKQMHRNEVDSQRSGKASFKFAWALDETEEERARGVTIDIALTKFETPQKDIVLLDAPGHVDFIPAVISGAAQADAALLVVDATRGEFETGFQAGGQTREHTFLVRSLGVKSLIVVVNKMDNVDWNWGRFCDIVDQLKPFLKQVGFNLKDDVQFVPVSGLTGDNLVERRQEKLLRQSSHPQLEGAAALTSGLDPRRLPSLIEAIDQMKQPERTVDKPTRVCVTDVFKGMSSGVFLGAKVISGKIEAKQKLLLLPPGELCDVKQVESRESGRLATSGGGGGSSSGGAYAGDIITTTVTGVEPNKFYRGCILCDPVFPCHSTNRFQARIIMFQNASAILMKGTPIEVHINGAFECGEVRKLISLLNKSTGELIQRRPRCVARNASAIIQLKLSRVVCCELYEDNKDLGRFMMRSLGKTIAAGLITKIKPAKVSRSGKTKMKSKR